MEAGVDLVSLAKEALGDDTYSVEYLYVFGPESQPFIEYILNKFDYKALHVEYDGTLSVTDKMMRSEFLSIKTTLNNPEVLRLFEGTGLMIREGDKNGYSSDFIIDIIKKWYRHETPITDYICIGSTHWTPESRAFYEENKTEEKDDRPFRKNTIFTRDDGAKCLLHSYQEHFLELWFEPFDKQSIEEARRILRPHA